MPPACRGRAWSARDPTSASARKRPRSLSGRRTTDPSACRRASPACAASRSRCRRPRRPACRAAWSAPAPRCARAPDDRLASRPRTACRRRARWRERRAPALRAPPAPSKIPWREATGPQGPAKPGYVPSSLHVLGDLVVRGTLGALGDEPRVEARGDPAEPRVHVDALDLLVLGRRAEQVLGRLQLARGRRLAAVVGLLGPEGA